MKNNYKNILFTLAALGSLSSFAENPHDPIEPPKSSTVDCQVFEEKKDRATEEVSVKNLSEVVALSLNSEKPLEISLENGLSFIASYKAKGAGPSLMLQIWAGGDQLLAQSDVSNFTPSASLKVPSHNEAGVFFGVKCYQRIEADFRQLKLDPTLLKQLKMKKYLNNDIIFKKNYSHLEQVKFNQDSLPELQKKLVEIFKAHGTDLMDSPEFDLFEAIEAYKRRMRSAKGLDNSDGFDFLDPSYKKLKTQEIQTK